MSTNPNEFIWQPSPSYIENSNLSQAIKELNLQSYQEFHNWSGKKRIPFWEYVIKKLNIVFDEPMQFIYDQNKWLPNAKYNIVNSCLNAESEKIAVKYASEENSEIKHITYQELKKAISFVVAGLNNLNLPENSAIAFYLPMNVECVIAYLGVIAAGHQVISIADSFASDEINKRIEIGKANLIITQNSYIRSGKKVNLYDNVKSATNLKSIVINKDNSDLTLRTEDLLWSQFISNQGAQEIKSCLSNSTINVLFSSGTTAEPKAIPWTHTTAIKSAMDGYFHQDIKTSDVVAWPSNIGWMMGSWLIFAGLINKACIAVFEGAATETSFLNFVDNAKVSILGTVPALVRAWKSKQPELKLANIKLFSSTGEASNESDYFWLSNTTNHQAPIIEYCGGTEIGGGYVTGTVIQPQKLACFSTPALGLNFSIYNELGERVRPGEVGEAFIIPPSIGLSEYLLNADHQGVYFKNCPVSSSGIKLRRHGDMLKELPGGYFQAFGRSDDVLNINGVKVGSLQVERLIVSNSKITDLAAVSVPIQGINKLIFFIVADSLSVNKEHVKLDLQAIIDKKLNPLFKIYDLVFIEQLPRTASNKIMRRNLKNIYLSL